MNTINTIPRLSVMESKARSGLISDVDFIMRQLVKQECFVTSKIVDHALGLVKSKPGFNRIKYYLYNGIKMQRYYAALYFKRMGLIAILDKAVEMDCIDREHAYSK